MYPPLGLMAIARNVSSQFNCSSENFQGLFFPKKLKGKEAISCRKREILRETEFLLALMDDLIHCERREGIRETGIHSSLKHVHCFAPAKKQHLHLCLFNAVPRSRP
ncbi:hypothetical protein CDAR_549071 [Caerostris darwini]|uniref:Uncharacterized protein n=1 Tax=Caerostris darwini TaxID=1538125 RepID=A0AAV4WJ23_9ARAC|nr:hypothetical protein CDAR_549071 [Caerostris darwini]